MTRVELVREVQRYFTLHELVDRPTYEKYGAFAWHFFDTRMLESLFVIRDKIIKKPMTINNWHMGGKFSQRGLRTNLSPEVLAKTKENKLSMSAHSTGKGWDFDVKGMTAEEVRQEIIKQGGKLPHPIRLEKDVTWVHADIYNDGKEAKVTQFKV